MHHRAPSFHNMNVIKKIILVAVIAAIPVIVFAAGPTSITINTNLPGTNPSSSGIQGFVANFYSFALIIAGILAFGAIVWGGIKYATGGGNPTSESEGKSWITGALLGLLLLGGAWIILTTVNPQIASLNIAGLPNLNGVSPSPSPSPTPTPINNCIPTSGGQGTCKNCTNSPGQYAVIGCLAKTPLIGISNTSFNGQHVCNPATGQVSCHFGGPSCSDGAHAFDYGINALSAKGISLTQAITYVQTCGAPINHTVTCFCETATAVRVACTGSNPPANHIHCNVDNAACGCN
jgi:TRAP-type C4-dicarboxylate transport system permease small subunit